MPDDRQRLDRRPVGTGEDGAYAHNRAPKIDGLDDTDDEDGTVEDEEQSESDLTLRIQGTPDATNTAAELGEDVPDDAESLRRGDRGAVNIEPDDFEP